MFTFANDGADIKSTNYWQSDHAKQGLIYVSTNAGVLRLLLPKASSHMLPEMRTGAFATIEPSIQSPLCWDIVFDDRSDAPFAVSVDKRQFDHALSPGKTRLAVWTEAGKQMELECSIKHA